MCTKSMQVLMIYEQHMDYTLTQFSMDLLSERSVIWIYLLTIFRKTLLTFDTATCMHGVLIKVSSLNSVIIYVDRNKHSQLNVIIGWHHIISLSYGVEQFIIQYKEKELSP